MLSCVKTRQVRRIMATYAADISGVCSALYELGGMTVMHDASGCHSTYTTHDEPRWSSVPSMVFLSGLTEMDAVLGNDERLIENAVEAAESLRPRFVCLIGTPVPMMMGTDLDAIAREIGDRTGIPGFGVAANCCHSYAWGVSKALASIAEIFVREPEGEKSGVNLLGATPLDFGWPGTGDGIAESLEKEGITVRSVWAAGDRCRFPAIEDAASAEVNVVLSAGGLGAARVMLDRFGIPFVAGVPVRDAAKLAEKIRMAAAGESPLKAAPAPEGESRVVLIGEPVLQGSLREEIERSRPELGPVRLIVPCPMTEDAGFARDGDLVGAGETEIMEAMKSAAAVVADPLYRAMLPEDRPGTLRPLPHPAFSGRIFSGSLPRWGREDMIEKLFPHGNQRN